MRTIILPADPQPVLNARVQDFIAAETDYRVTSVPPLIDPVTGIPIPQGSYRTTDDNTNRTLNPYGEPAGLDPSAVMPYNGGVQQAYGVELDLISVVSNGTATIQVTCRTAHGLSTNGQIAVEGLALPAACGFFSVTVISPLAFTYQTYGKIQPFTVIEPYILLQTDAGILITTDSGLEIGTSQVGGAVVPAGGLLTPTTRMITCLIGLPLGYTQIPQLSGPQQINSSTVLNYPKRKRLRTDSGFRLTTDSGRHITTSGAS